MTKGNLPQHFRYLNPILEVLQEIGGSGRSSEVVDLVIEKLDISEKELQVTIKSGPSRIINQIHWARLVLVKIGYIDSSKRGVWSLTEKGLSATLSEDDLLGLYALRKRWVRESIQKKKEAEAASEDEELDDEAIGENLDYKDELLYILQNLPPAGFERICQWLLREAGFEQVTVTGRSGDGGIDGIGLLQVNPFVSFKVLFQCKRYQGAVNPSQVRDFRGAMQGRADKGIIMTTGRFTRDAKAEARRDGVTPIEIVDGSKLIEMFELYEFGLNPITTYELDHGFFDNFRD